MDLLKPESNEVANKLMQQAIVVTLKPECAFKIDELVLARHFRLIQNKWMPAIIAAQLGRKTYELQTDDEHICT